MGFVLRRKSTNSHGAGVSVTNGPDTIGPRLTIPKSALDAFDAARAAATMLRQNHPMNKDQWSAGQTEDLKSIVDIVFDTAQALWDIVQANS